jgi:hypothetical protein
MNWSKLTLCFGTLALAVASAASTYRVTLFQPSVVGGSELKPGDYKIEVAGDKAVIKTGKNTVEAPVKVETGDEKFGNTAVRYATSDGKARIQEIRLGGTNTKLVFNN